MKIKNIASICKKRKTVLLCDCPDVAPDDIQQWIGDGVALYPTGGLPPLDEENVYTLFEVDKKAQEKWCFSRTELPKTYCFDDTVGGETRIIRSGLSIFYDGRTLEPLWAGQELLFIDNKYLKPLEDMLTVIDLYERKMSNGASYVAVKAGMILRAVIMPHDPISKVFVDELKGLATRCEGLLLKKKARENATQITIDSETGEVL